MNAKTAKRIAVLNTLSAKAVKKLPPRYTTDATYAWAVSEYGDQALDWATLASGYMRKLAEQRGSGYGSRLHTISLFIRKYIAKHQLWDPRSLLVSKRESELPVLFGTEGNTPFKITCGNVNAVNRICDFLDWVMENDPQRRFGEWEDGQFTRAPNCHAPFAKRDFRGITRVSETEKAPMPWKMILELREKLAPGIHFSDWAWAIARTGRQGGTQSGDWFEVRDKRIAAMIDLKPGDERYDPDLVLRRVRLRAVSAKGYGVERWNAKTKKSETVYREAIQAWSPITALAILTKLEVCARTFQVRMLNSGEADLQRVELVDKIVDGTPEPEFVWGENRNRDAFLEGLRIEDRVRVLGNSGVFRPFESRFSEQQMTGMFFNTNKTGDRGKDPTDRGYFVPWEHKTLLRWLLKGRNWQEKYNPIKAPTLWTQGATRHFGMEMSPADLKHMPPTCFLFRDASALNMPAFRASPLRWTPVDHALPITKQCLDKYWGALLVAYQKDLETRGETIAGKPIKLIKRIHGRSNSVTTKHPLHSMRVSLLSALAFEGRVPVTILMKLAGHSNLVMTLFYLKMNETVLNEIMETAHARMELDKNRNYAAWMAQCSFKEITSRMVLLDEDAIRSVVPNDLSERDAYRWLQVSDGWCAAGGNTSPIPGGASRQTPGCYNGGRRLKNSDSGDYPAFGAVPPRRCANFRCRWLWTGPAFLEALRAKFNLKARLLSEFEQIREKTQRKVEALKDARYDAARDRHPFDSADLDRMETLLQRQEADAMLASVEADNIAYVIGRCLELVQSKSHQPAPETQKIAALGTFDEVRIAIETDHSELFALSGICLDAEIYPELEGEATSSIFRRSQLLEPLIHREQGQPSLISFSRELQLEIGNRYTQNMIIAQEAELLAANKSLPQGKREILRIALTNIQKAAESKQAIPLYLREALDVVHSGCQISRSRPQKNLLG